MTETKPERLGVRGQLALCESALRLLGAANATGVIAAGAAFHALEKYGHVLWYVKQAAICFLFGVLTFVVGYVCWFWAAVDMDLSLREPDDPEEPLLVKPKSAKEHRRASKRGFNFMLVAGAVSFCFFLLGLIVVMMVSVRL